MNREKEKRIRPRMVPRNGTTPITRLGTPRAWRQDIYIRLLDAPWRSLWLLIAALYLVANLIFAVAYLALGDGIAGAHPGSFADAFFFSVQTMATIGYGQMVPRGVAANLLVTLEALTGFAYFAIVTGLVFSKFSRPTARVMFSNVAVVCPYNGVPHLMLRLANERGNRIVDATVQVMLLRTEISAEGHDMRRFHDLHLVRSKVPVLQLTWTVMHPLDEHSPLYGMTPETLRDTEAEILVSLTGLDESLSQTIHARHSYVGDEIICGAAFVDILRPTGDGGIEVDYRLFHQTKPLSAP